MKKIFAYIFLIFCMSNEISYAMYNNLGWQLAINLPLMAGAYGSFGDFFTAISQLGQTCQLIAPGNERLISNLIFPWQDLDFIATECGYDDFYQGVLGTVESIGMMISIVYLVDSYANYCQKTKITEHVRFVLPVDNQRNNIGQGGESVSNRKKKRKKKEKRTAAETIKLSSTGQVQSHKFYRYLCDWRNPAHDRPEDPEIAVVKKGRSIRYVTCNLNKK